MQHHPASIPVLGPQLVRCPDTLVCSARAMETLGGEALQGKRKGPSPKATMGRSHLLLSFARRSSLLSASIRFVIRGARSHQRRPHFLPLFSFITGLPFLDSRGSSAHPPAPVPCLLLLGRRREITIGGGLPRLESGTVSTPVFSQ
ncbi:hypothetical protein TEQG_06888 [Trichophyton equinum CBS 127.97]|uniref:Uncharacterized protein n=1 Tax=Trichophyton equinum (strain ATCC MYA-4606 / CBS 127.97) TaxID=559882 RepID=F2Q1W9_TRIEC|nr:hypothetical protein TEQG_06888 [Trichophyton equinum CBS 127.97]